jgi:putative hydrolase of HD superfamily
MLKKIVKFLFEVGMLKRTPRTGYQFLGSGGESVADHSFRAAVIGYALASQESGANRDKVILMCLLHDFPETRTGDHNYVNKRYVKADEQRVIRDQVHQLPFGDEVQALIYKFNSAETPEARLAKDADQLDLIMELKQQMEQGNPNAKDWLSFAVKRLLTENARKMAQEILNTHSTEWWFDKKTDWWINGPENQKTGE